ncbi:unnamed protein product [Caenorhabditis brenneri]
MSFPLRRLPFVVLSILFSCLKPEELIRLSFLSKRCYTLTKALRKKPKDPLRINLSPYASIGCSDRMNFEIVDYSENRKKSKLEILKIGKNSFFINQNSYFDILTIYCENDRIQEVLMTFGEYITDFFGIQIEKVSFDGESSSCKIIDWLMTRQKILCEFECEIIGDNELRYLLDHCKVSKKMELNVKTSTTFRYTFREPLQLEHFELEGTPWPSINNLIDINSRYLWMKDSNFTSENINFFLKNWLNGGNSKLGFLSIKMEKNVNEEILLEGLEVIQRRDVMIRYLMKRGGFFDFNSSYELKRNDGTIASLVINYNRSSTDFLMFVWPDWQGKPYPRLAV